MGKVDYGESIDVVKNLKTLLNHQINIPKHAILLKKVRLGSTSGITQAVFKNYRTLYVTPYGAPSGRLLRNAVAYGDGYSIPAQPMGVSFYYHYIYTTGVG